MEVSLPLVKHGLPYFLGPSESSLSLPWVSWAVNPPAVSKEEKWWWWRGTSQIRTDWRIEGSIVDRDQRPLWKDVIGEQWECQLWSLSSEGPGLWWLLNWGNQIAAFVSLYLYLEKRILPFSLRKKGGFSNLTQFSALNIGRASTGHLVQVVTPSQTAMADGIGHPSNILRRDVLDEQLITFWAGLSLRQPSMTRYCVCFAVSFVHWSQLYPLISHK
jgi:hypothetical protein